MTGTGWFALSDRMSGGFMRGAALPAVLARGALVVEARAPAAGPLRLIDYRDSRGWSRGLAIELGRDGGLALHQWQGGDARRFVLPGPVAGAGEEIRIGFAWDAPAGRCTLAAGPAEGAGGEGWRRAGGQAPLPLTAEDAEALAGRPDLAVAAPEVGWLGLAAAAPAAAEWDGACLGAETPVATPSGLRAAGRLRPGELVLTPEGPRTLAAVRRTDLPMLGAAAPVRLRAPFHARGQDVLCGPRQGVLIEGSDVEYLLGAEAVLAEARWLVDGRTALRERRAAALPCVVLALARPGLILGDGLAFQAAAPPGAAAPLPVLRRHEALALLSLRERGRARRGG